MAAPSITQIRNRYEALLGRYEGMGTIITNDNDPITTLPAARVYSRGATHTLSSPKRRLVTRVFELHFFILEIKHTAHNTEVLAAFEDCEPWLNNLTIYLLGFPLLRLPGVDAGLVFETGAMTDSGIGLTGHNMRTYAGFKLSQPVTIAPSGA